MLNNILIVDDSATSRALIKRVIKMCDLSVGAMHEAPNGRAAMELMQRTKMDLVLADLNMPEMDGFEMTRRLREAEATKNVPVIIVSASPDAQRFAEFQRAGCVAKPFTPEAIRQVIVSLLEKPNATAA